MPCPTTPSSARWASRTDVALTATIYQFDVDLADADRGVYETLALRVARHPSESEDYLVARVLAYGLEYTDGIAFGAGISSPDDPAIAVRDLTGTLTTWIDIGAPAAARLHKAGKTARRVAVYAHRDPRQWLRQLDAAAIHRAADLDIYSFDRAVLDGLVNQLARRVAFALSISDGHLLVASDRGVVEGAVRRHRLSPG